MNWYKQSQVDYSSRHNNYLLNHKVGDAVWIFDQHQNLHVDYPSSDGKVTHNKSFGLEGKNYMFKGRYNPENNIVTIIDHKNFLSTNERYWQKQLENALVQEFGPNINIKYF